MMMMPSGTLRTTARAGQAGHAYGICPVPSRYPRSPTRDTAGQCPGMSRLSRCSAAVS